MNADHIIRSVGRQAAERWEIEKAQTAVKMTIELCQKVGIPYKGHRSIKTLKKEHGVELTIVDQQETPLIWEAIMIASKDNITKFMVGYIVRIEVGSGMIRTFPIEPTAKQLAEFKRKAL
jgi:hypothetical protein